MHRLLASWSPTAAPHQKRDGGDARLFAMAALAAILLLLAFYSAAARRWKLRSHFLPFTAVPKSSDDSA